MHVCHIALLAAALTADLSSVVAQAPAIPALSAAAQAATLAEAPGKDRLVATCGGCHDPRVVIGQHHDLAGWQDVIDRMVDHGAVISDPDYAAIATYLAKNV